MAGDAPLGIDARKAPSEIQIQTTSHWRDRTGDTLAEATARTEARRLARQVIGNTELKANRMALARIVKVMAPDSPRCPGSDRSPGRSCWWTTPRSNEYHVEIRFGELHDECDRVDQRPLLKGGPRPGPLPERAGSNGMPVPGRPALWIRPAVVGHAG